MKIKTIKLLFILSIVLITLVFFACFPNEKIPPADRNYSETMQSGNFTRNITVHIPQKAADGELTPVVVAFHGYGDTGQYFKESIGFDQHIDLFGTIMVFPSAIPNSEGKPSWSTFSDPEIDPRGVDDMQFFVDIIAKLDEEYNIDHTKIYVFGYSQGGFLVNNLVVEKGHMIAAYGIIASSLYVDVAEDIVVPLEIPVFAAVSKTDGAITWEGEYDWGIYSYLSQEEFLQKLVWNNKCNTEPVITTITPGYVTKKSFKDISGNVKVDYYEMDNIAHWWGYIPFDIEEELLRFFLQFEK